MATWIRNRIHRQFPLSRRFKKHRNIPISFYKRGALLRGVFVNGCMQYLCQLGDQELRQQTTRAMADFLWNSIKVHASTPPLSLPKEPTGMLGRYRTFSSDGTGVISSICKLQCLVLLFDTITLLVLIMAFLNHCSLS